MSVARRNSKVVRLRAATVCTVLAAALVSGCGGSSGLSSQDKKDFVKGCTQSSGGKMAFCQCYLDQLVKRGLDTTSEIKSASENTQKGNTDPKLRAAVLACKSQL